MVRHRKRLAVALASLVLALVAAEVGLRVEGSRRARATTLETLLDGRAPLAAGEVGGWLDLLRVRDEPGLVYDYRPGFDGLISMGGVETRVRTNRDGFRAGELPHAKPPGTVRIVGLGDSFMLGFGLDAAETYLALVEDALRERFPATPTEVVDAAATGYNTGQMAATLREKALRYEPDLVLLALLKNDLSPVIYRTRATVDDPLLAPRSSLLDALLSARAPAEEPDEDADPAADRSAKAPTEAEWRAFEAALDEIARLRDRHGFRVLAFSYYSGHATERMRRLCRERDFLTDDLGRDLRAYMEERGIAKVAGSELAVAPDNAHPSALHARLIADALLEALEERGLLNALYGDG